MVAVTAPQASAAAVAPLAISDFDDIVAGPSWGALFISQGLAGPGVLVTDAEGQPQQTLANTAGSRHLALSNDGQTLWVALAEAGEVAGFSTDTFGEVARYSMPAGVCPGSIAETVADMDPEAATDLRTLLAIGHACNQWGSGSSASGGVGVFDPITETFEALTFAQPTYRPIVASSPGSGDIFVAGDLGISPTKLVTVTSIGGFPDTVAVQSNTGSNLEDLVVTPDGARVVQASGYPYQHASYSLPFLGADVVFTSTNYPNAVAVSADGSRVATGTNSAHGADVRIHDASGSTLRSVDLAPALLADGGLAVSPDGTITYAIVRLSDGSFGFTALTAVPEAEMTLAVPAEMTFGVQFIVAGSLTFDGAPIGGLDVEVTRFATGAAPVLVGVVPTRSDGTFRIVDVAAQAGPVTYEASFAGAADLPAATAEASMIVRYETNLTISGPDEVFTGEPFDITGDLELVGAGAFAVAEIAVARSIPGTTITETLPSVVTASDGSFVFTDTLTEPGTVSYSFSFEGGEYWYPSFASTYLYARVGIDTTMTIDAPAAADVDEWFEVTGTLTADDGRSTEGAWVFLVRTVASGTALYAGEATVGPDGSWAITTAINVAGPAVLTAEFSGDDYLDPAAATATVQIEAAPAPSLTINAPPESYAGESVRVWGQLSDSAGDPLTASEIEIMLTDGMSGHTTLETVVTNPNGVYELDFVPEATGSQIVTARFFDGGVVPVVNRSAEIFILARPTGLSASGPPAANVGDPVTITGSLIDLRSGGALVGRSVSVTRQLNGGTQQLGSATTDASGSFTFLDTPGAVGAATYDIAFNGADIYDPSSATVSVAIERQGSSVAVTATPLSGKKNRGKYTVAAGFTDGGPTRTLSLYAQTAAGETLIATGSSISIVVQPSETTTYVARFAGNPTYAPSEATVTVTASGKGGGKPKR